MWVYTGHFGTENTENVPPTHCGPALIGNHVHMRSHNIWIQSHARKAWIDIDSPWWALPESESESELGVCISGGKVHTSRWKISLSYETMSILTVEVMKFSFGPIIVVNIASCTSMCTWISEVEVRSLARRGCFSPLSFGIEFQGTARDGFDTYLATGM